MRKILTFLCAALMSVGMFALTPLSGDTWDEGTKTLTVNSNLPENAYQYQDVIQHVIINNGVTSIGVDAFYYCSGLTSVTIPNSVTSIGDYAFYRCSVLTSVTINAESLESYGSDVFYNTHANLKIYVPAESVDTYKTAWSAYADKIKAIPPAWVRDGDEWDYATKTLTVNSDLPRDAYKDQTVIEHVIISDGITSIEWRAFYNCTGLTSVTIPNSVTSIGLQAFGDCTGLTSIEIPSSVTSIEGQAFGDCTSLESVTIHAESLEWYGLLAFQGTPATLKIYVPVGSVNTYKAGWYTYADKITAIPPAWVLPGDAWDDATKTLTVKSNLPENAYKDQTVIEHVIISSGVTSVGNSAFYGCTGLTSITIPNSITSIGNAAFAECSGLTSITIPNSVTNIGTGAFYGCSGLTSPVYNDHVFAYMPTSNSGTYTIPDGIESIAGGAFYGCSGLTSVTIGDHVTSIGDYTFAVCTALTSITIPNSVISIGEGAFAGCSDLTSVTIGNSVTSIGAEAFAGCSGLTSITIPKSVDSIGDYTFAVCSGLTSITIPNSVKSIGEMAFGMCGGLTSVTIGNSVTSIGDSAFMMCSNLESVTCVRETPASLGNDAFNECSNLNAIYVPCGTLDAYQSSWTQYQSNIQYAQPEYTIIGNVNIAGAGTVILPQTICDNSITASPNYGYHFVQWSDGNTENPRTIELTQDTTFTAEFAKNYSITINESSHGSVLASSSSAAPGETITLTATPDDGYQLKSIRVYVPVFETLNNTALTVNGNKFQAQATLRNTYGWRVYNPGTANTLTVSSLNGTTLINKIEFIATMGGQRTNDMLSVSAGTLSFDGNDPSTTVTINDINATSVTISGSGTNDAKTWNINSVKVYTEEELEISDTENANVKTFTMVDSEVTISAEFEPAPVAVTISSAGWATFCSNYALDFSGTGVNAYIITGHSGSAITKSEALKTVPANTPLLLNAAANTYEIPVVASSSTVVSANKLKAGTGAAVSAESGKTKYVLGAVGEPAVATFLKINATPATVPVGKAYLQFDEVIAGAPSALRLEDEENNATNIEDIEANKQAVKFIENGQLLIRKDGVVYDTMGRVIR